MTPVATNTVNPSTQTPTTAAKANGKRDHRRQREEPHRAVGGRAQRRTHRLPQRDEPIPSLQLWQRAGNRTAEARCDSRCWHVCVEPARPEGEEGRERHPHPCPDHRRQAQAKGRSRKGHHQAKPSCPGGLPFGLCLRCQSDRGCGASRIPPGQRRCGGEPRPSAFVPRTAGNRACLHREHRARAGHELRRQDRFVPGQSKAEEFSTLVHELAHEMLHKAERRTATTKVVRETKPRLSRLLWAKR